MFKINILYLSLLFFTTFAFAQIEQTTEQSNNKPVLIFSSGRWRKLYEAKL